MKLKLFQRVLMLIVVTPFFFILQLDVVEYSFASGGGGGGGGGNPNIGYNASKSKKAATKKPKKKTVKKSAQKAKKKNVGQTTARKTKKKITPRKREVAESGLPPSQEERFLNDEVIVRFQLSSFARERDRLIARLGLLHLDGNTFFLPGVTVHRYRLPAGLNVRDAIAQLEADPAVVNAQPNYLYWLQQDQNGEKLPQFGNDLISLGDAHRITKGKGSRIAVIDAAVDVSHSELSVADMVAFDVSDLSENNVDSHGTSIAGILAAGSKLTGVAPEAKLITIAAFSKNASGEVVGNTWTILEALNVALKEQAGILNLSFAGPPDPLLERSFVGAKKRNILPIAAMGNEGPTGGMLYPAGYETVIAVTATNQNNEIYANANIGEHVDIAAPGVGVLVLGNESGFRSTSGTSMATAYVSGIAALALSENPQADYDTLRSLIEGSTRDLGKEGKDEVFGFGIPNAALAANPNTN